MADDVEKGLYDEQDCKKKDAGEGLDIDEGVVPIHDGEGYREGDITSEESTPEHLLTEKTPLTKLGSKSNDIELQDLKKKRRLTKEVVNSSLRYVSINCYT